MKQECGVMYLKKEMGCALLLHVSVTNQCLPFLNVASISFKGSLHLKNSVYQTSVFLFLRYALADKV